MQFNFTTKTFSHLLIIAHIVECLLHTFKVLQMQFSHKTCNLCATIFWYLLEKLQIAIFEHFSYLKCIWPSLKIIVTLVFAIFVRFEISKFFSMTKIDQLDMIFMTASLASFQKNLWIATKKYTELPRVYTEEFRFFFIHAISSCGCKNY